VAALSLYWKLEKEVLAFKKMRGARCSVELDAESAPVEGGA